MAKIKNQNKLKIDVVIPSIRLDTENLLSMLCIDIPPDVDLHYYIISDNPSLSSTSFIHNGFPVDLIVNSENLGAPLSRNVGLDIGTGDYIFLIDDDVTPSPDILFSYLSSIRDEPDAPGYVGPTKFPTAINSFTKGIRISDILTFFDISLTRKWVAWGTTSNLLICRKKMGDIRFSSVFPKHGGGEDIDFCLQIIEKNNKWFKTVPDAVVAHNWWKNGRRTYTRFFRWAFGDSRLSKIHPKHKYYNFPNMVETLFLGLLILSGLSLSGLLPFYSIGLWAGLVVISEFTAEQIRVKIRHPNSSLRDSIEATIIRLSNDLGRLAGSLRDKDAPVFFTRFDFFVTKESISFERKIAMIKFILFSSSILSMYFQKILDFILKHQ